MLEQRNRELHGYIFAAIWDGKVLQIQVNHLGALVGCWEMSASRPVKRWSLPADTISRGILYFCPGEHDVTLRGLLRLNETIGPFDDFEDLGEIFIFKGETGATA